MTGNYPFIKKQKPADYTSSPSFYQKSKILLVFPNNAKNCFSTIYKGLMYIYWLM